MSTTVDLIYQHAKRLPERRALEVLDFIKFLESRMKSPDKQRAKNNPYPLRDKPLRYREPFAPVAENDWDALA